MTQNNYLLTRIAEAYDIKQGLEEDPLSYKARIIYSAIGEAAFASLFDDNGEGYAPSVVHVKRKVCSLLQDYKVLYSECVGWLTHDGEELAEEIYWLYRSSGIIYHEPNHVSPAYKASARAGNVVFTRAYSPGQKQKRSGLGTYTVIQLDTYTTDLYKLYHLDMDNLVQIWEKCIDQAVWVPASFEGPVEYLNVPSQKSKGYWVDRVNDTVNISMCRTGVKGAHIYYLCRKENGRLVVSPLAQWKTEYPLNEANNTENHRLYTNACLAYYHKLPPSRFLLEGDIVRINVGYLMPPAERYFLNLYSWPESQVSLPYNFKRICSRQIFNAVREVLSPLGFVFIEG